MSDFDTVLERLLSDPAFKSHLAADPASALAGYRLTHDELDLLQAQIEGGPGGQSRVEQRTSKASMFGLFSSLGAGVGDVVHGHGLGDAGHQVDQGLDQPAGGRHAALEPDDHRPAGLFRHVADVNNPGRSGLADAQAQAGPGGAYASAGPIDARTGYPDPAYGQAGFNDADPAYGQPAYGQAGLGDAQSQPGYGRGGFDQAQPDRVQSAYDNAQANYGQSGLTESAQSHSAGESSSQGTIYRSSTYVSSSSESHSATPPPPQDGHGLGGLIGQSHVPADPVGQSGGAQSGGGQHGLAGIVDQSRLAAEQGQGQTGGRHGLDGLVGQDLNPQGQAPTDGYHTRVDWDGDGKWDRHTYVNRPDGGVDIVVDTDGDGRAEFIGHDTDRDGLINSSEVDTNHDGVADARYEDLNGDGWLDRRTR